MNTNEEMNLLNENELAQVSGGDIDGDIEITFELIMQYIEAGNERMAADLFKLAQYSLTTLEAYTIRMTFLTKFGYPIEMYGG